MSTQAPLRTDADRRKVTTNHVVALVAGGALFAAFPRLWMLDAQSLWYDEGVSARMVTRSFAEIAAATSVDIHPPLYYWLLATWSAAFGDSEWTLRVFSAALGSLAAGVTGVLAARIRGAAAGVLAVLVLTVSPLAVQYGQEVRMYALASLLAAGSALACHWTITAESPSTRRAALHGLTTSALVYTHYYAVTVAVAQHLVLVWWAVRGRTRGHVMAWMAAVTLPVLMYLPWLPIALRQVSYYPGLGTPRSATEIAVDALNVLSLGLATTRFEPRLGLVPFLGLALAGLWDLRRDRTHALPLVGLWLAVPIGAVLALSAGTPRYEPRFLMLVAPAWCVAIALGVWSVARGGGALLAERAIWLAPARATICVILIGMLLVPTARSLRSYYSDPRYARDDYRSLVASISREARAGDTVLLTAPGQIDVVSYYARRADPGLLGRIVPLPRERPINGPATVQSLEALAASTARVWLVRWAHREADPDDLIGQWLGVHLAQVQTRTFGAVELWLYSEWRQR
ncbi:MAG: glycosyltransferase family 39 protein [Chloroflexota bacterium]